MQQDPGLEIGEQIQHGITFAQFVLNLIQSDKIIHCHTIQQRAARP
jgi:hypothetical protein